MDFRPMIFPERMKAIALADPLRAALAMSDAASELFSKSAQRLIISSVIGGSSNQVGCRNATLPTNHRWPTASRSLATALWAARSLTACSAELHHALGRDPRAHPLTMPCRIFLLRGSPTKPRHTGQSLSIVTAITARSALEVTISSMGGDSRVQSIFA
jgi:hypothetical protein